MSTSSDRDTIACLLFQLRFQLPEAVQRALQVFDDLIGQDVRRGEAVEVGEGLVLDPENVQALLVPFPDLVGVVAAPSPIGVLLGPGLPSLEPVFGIVAGNEIGQIRVCHGILLQGEVDVGAQIVDPDLSRLLFRTCRAFIEKDHVGFNTGLVEDSRRQAENGVQVRGVEQLFAHSLSRAALKEDVVWHDHGGLAGALQDRVDVLHKVELLVAAGGPEIRTVVGQVLFLLLPFLVGEGVGGFFAKGWIRQHIVHAIAGVREQGIAPRDGNAAIDIADVVQIQIHQAELEGGGDQLVSVEGAVFQKFLLLPVQAVPPWGGQIVLGRGEKAAAAAAGVRNGFSWLRT